MMRKILIVDDDEAMKDNLEDILGDKGYHLLSASNCTDALELAIKENPHVALIDLKLPDGSGLNLLSDLKHIRPDCVCAVVTAFADLDSAMAAVEQGAFQYLQKPVRPTELLRLLEQIFDPFFTTKEMGKGTGLGLAMAYGIIKKHQGHITCKSSPGEGTQFNIYLPAIDMAAENEITTKVEPLTRGNNELLLVVEDEEMLRSLAKDMLIRGGYRVLEADSGEKGVITYQENKDEISLVILDLIMPGMGGKQCLAEILKVDPRARVIIASGFALNDSETADILSTAKGFIRKPYYFRDMLRVIRETLDSAS